MGEVRAFPQGEGISPGSLNDASDPPPHSLDEVAQWLRHSPNNPGYEDSDIYRMLSDWLDTNSADIAAELQDGVENLNFEPASNDAYQLVNTRDPYVLSEVANAGMRPVVDAFSYWETTVEDGHAIINERARRAVGAIMLRGVYMSKVAELHGEVKELYGDRPFLTVYRQNILATIQRAAWLEQQTSKKAAVTSEFKLAA